MSEMLIALPGEQHPRNLIESSRALAGPCAGGVPGHFCAYSGPQGTGSVMAMQSCDDYPIPGSRRNLNGSWGNNQKDGETAYFFNSAGRVVDTAPAQSNNQNCSWAEVNDIILCGIS